MWKEMSDLFLVIIVSERGRFKIYGHPYTLYSNVPRFQCLPFSSYITSHYITIDLGFIPLLPRAFMWVWETLNRLEPIAVEYSNDEILAMSVYLHHFQIPSGDYAHLMWENYIFPMMTPLLTDSQLIPLRKVVKPEERSDSFDAHYLRLLPFEEMKQTVPPTLRKWVRKISGVLGQRVPSRVGPDGNHLYLIVFGSDYHIVDLTVPEDNVDDHSFFDRDTDEGKGGIFVTDEKILMKDASGNWMLRVPFEEEKAPLYISYFYTVQELPISRSVVSRHKKVVPKEIYQSGIIRGRRFIVGTEMIPVFGSLPVMAARSEYFAAIRDDKSPGRSPPARDGGSSSLRIMADYTIENLEAFRYVWSYLNGLHEIGESEVSWDVLVDTWQYIVYFGIPLRVACVDDYLNAVFEKALIVGRKSLPFLMSLIGKKGIESPRRFGAIPRDVLNQTSLYESGPLSPCLADLFLSSIRGFEPTDTIQTPQYNKWSVVDHPNLTKGGSVDMMVIWNIRPSTGKDLINNTPYFIEGEFFRRPMGDIGFPGMRTMTITTAELQPEDGNTSVLASRFYESIRLSHHGERIITFIADERDRITMVVYHQEVNLGGPYNVAVTFIRR